MDYQKILREKIEDLGVEIGQLKKLAVGQAAMIALLTTLLAKKEVLGPEEAMMVALAAVDAQDQEGLDAHDVAEWVQRNLRSVLGDGEPT